MTIISTEEFDKAMEFLSVPHLEDIKRAYRETPDWEKGDFIKHIQDEAAGDWQMIINWDAIKEVLEGGRSEERTEH